MEMAQDPSGRLTEMERACAHLVQEHGWTLRDVAIIFGCSQGLVATRLKSAAAKGFEVVKQA